MNARHNNRVCLRSFIHSFIRSFYLVILATQLEGVGEEAAEGAEGAEGTEGAEGAEGTEGAEGGDEEGAAEKPEDAELQKLLAQQQKPGADACMSLPPVALLPCWICGS
jgi:hypothetical protein